MTERTPSQYLVGLNLVPALTPRRMAILLDRFASPEAIWRATEEDFAALPEFAAVAGKVASGRSEEGLDRELERAEVEGIRIVTLLDPDYPLTLRAIETPPAVLYLKGERAIDTARTIAIVGTRRASRYGRSVAERLGEDLGRVGITVVSGLALGIDSAAHRGALKAQGTTVAVLGSGLLRLYPASNRSLAEEIAARGLLVSEYPLETPPAKWTFPQRNRVLSGIARGVVVVEAPKRSGALITARLALEEGREVFAVPGNVTSLASVGTNRLIKDGAKLVEGGADVLAEFPDLATLIRTTATERERKVTSLTPAERRIYDLVSLEPIHMDDIIARGELTPSEVAHALLVLQMEDLIQEAEGRRYIRTP